MLQRTGGTAVVCSSAARSLVSGSSAPAAEHGALLRHEVASCTAGRAKEGVIQPGCRAIGLRTAGASLATVGSQARRRRWEAESHGGRAAENDGSGYGH
jgi:hypothetical protein